MYLLVFVTLVIGLIGLYGQILSLQAARITAGMTGLANSMITWHTAAVSMGAKIVDNPSGGFTVPCSLTASLPTVAANQLNFGSVSPCVPPVGAVDNSSPPVADTNGTVTKTALGGGLNGIDAAGDLVHLPPDYNRLPVIDIQFYSILYQGTNGQYYVITFVPPPVISASNPAPNPAPGFISLPPHNNLLSFSLADLQHQLSLTPLPDYSYGQVKTDSLGLTSVLVSRGLENGTACTTGASPTCFQYAPPFQTGKAMMLNGTIAIVSSTASF